MEKEISVKDLDDLVKSIQEARVVKDEIEAQLKEQNKKISALEQQALGYLEDLGREKYQSESGTISKQQQWYFRLPETEEDKMEFFDYLKEKGLFERYATVNSMSYNSYCRKEFEIAVEEGRGMSFTLPGVPEPTLNKKLSFRKGK